MRNAFFVHTPLQMVIAQQIIRQESLKNNILLYGYIDDNKQFIEAYKLIKIDSLWEESIYVPNLPVCVEMTHRRLFRGFYYIYKNVKELEAYFKMYQISDIYIGDIDNICYQFLMKYFNGKYRISIYEEGVSHYLYKKREPYQRRMQKVQEFLLDTLYYMPVFHFPFANYWYREGDYDNLPIDVRYTIVPGYYNESFDRQLKLDYDFLSDNLRSYLKDEIDVVSASKNVSFLITSMVYENATPNVARERYLSYLETIQEYLSCISNETTIAVKLHPREGNDVKRDIERLLTGNNRNFVFLAKEVNLPIELYLQILKPKEITVFYNSSMFYNGYLYPQCKILDLFPQFLSRCENKGLKVDDLKKYCV